MSDALTGVRVLDLATLYPAPLVAAILGDHGADVVKVEPPDGDPLRAFGSAPWAVAGRNKRSVCLALDSTEGLDLLARLTAVCDVVVLNQPPEVAARWRCGDDDLLARNPRVVVAHVSAFGASGPYAGRAGNGSVAEAFVGLAPSGVPLGDVFGATTAVNEVLAALYRRDANGGSGAIIDVSLYEALLPLLATRVATGANAPVARLTVVAADGTPLAIVASTPSQRDRLAALTGDDAAAWAADRTASEALTSLAGARVPAAPVHDDLDHLATDEHVVARGSLSSRARAGAPALGEHTDQVVEEWLGGSRHA